MKDLPRRAARKLFDIFKDHAEKTVAIKVAI
jgi:hypothetical protein